MAECLLYLARNFADMRLAALNSAAGDIAYSAVSMAISRLENDSNRPGSTTTNQSCTGTFQNFDGLAVLFFYYWQR